MNISKTATTVGVGLAIVAGSMLAVNAASAHFGGSDEKKAERITALAEKLGVEESAVENAFNELKEEHKAERESARAEHLAGLVEAGKLTQAQADTLSSMKDEAKAEIEALRESGADREAIKAAMEENKEALKAWAESEGINLEDIRPEGAEKGRRGHHRFGS